MKRTLALLVPAAVVSAVLVVAAVAVEASSPTVPTGSHSHVTDSSAVLHGTVNPNGSATTYYFQWGLTTAYRVQSADHSAGVFMPHGFGNFARYRTSSGVPCTCSEKSALTGRSQMTDSRPSG